MTQQEMTPVAAEALAKYQPSDAAIAEMRSEYMPIRVESVEDRAGAKRAHEARMVVKGHRVAIEKTRVALKADALAFGRSVDAEAKRLKGLLEPIESHLLEQEEIVTKEAERRKKAEEERRLAVMRDRMQALTDVNSRLLPADVAQMTDDEFGAALAGATAEFNAALEAERVAAERRRAEEERLAAERAELERQREEQAKEQRAKEEALAKERAAQEAEAKRIADERAAIEAEKAAAAREAEIKAAEERAAEAAREKARLDAQRAEEERLRREAMRPTVEKLLGLADAVLALPVPEFQAEDEVKQVLARAAQEIRAIAAR